MNEHRIRDGLLSFGLALLGLFLLCMQGHHIAKAVTRDKVDPVDSCVAISYLTGFGSGAIVGPNQVLTARHIAENIEFTDLAIYTNDGDVRGVIDAIYDPNDDVALLIIEGEFDETPLEIDITPLEVRDEIEAIGAPGTLAIMNSVLPGHVIKVNSTIDYGYVFPGKNIDMHDAHIAGGCSGGPVLDMDGRIRGVQVLGGFGHGGAVPAEEFVKDLGLSR